MPVQTGKDSKGCYARWGEEGKKYYYECGNEQARDNAKDKAHKQGVAIGDFKDNCSFAVNFADNNIAIGEDNFSEPFLILEHKESDDFEYRNGMLAFTLSEKKLKQMAASFKKKELGRDLYINYDHEADGRTIAAGWIREVKVEKTENGYGLFARAEWSPDAAKYIKNKEYVYFSAECRIEGMTIKFDDEILYDPKIKKSVLTGGALTNNPFFKTTNLSLSENNNGELNMADYAELNAEFEQYKQNKELELQDLKAKFEAKDAEILKLSAEIAEIKKANKDAMIASFVAKLPEDAKKREKVKAELEETYEAVGEAKFSRFAELIIKENDTRTNPKNFDGKFEEKPLKLSIDEQYKIENEKWSKRKES